MTRVRAKATGTARARSTSRTISPRSRARRRRVSSGMVTLGWMTSNITATGWPSARSRREVVVAWASMSRSSASPTSRPTARRSMRSSSAASVTPRRLASDEYGSRRSRRSLSAVGHTDASDEGAASLAAHDLARVLEPRQGGAQRSPRDPEHHGDLVLRREPVARTVATRREPVAQRLLGAVDERRPFGLLVSWRCYRGFSSRAARLRASLVAVRSASIVVTLKPLSHRARRMVEARSALSGGSLASG